MELGQDADQGPLVLQGAASTHPPLVLLLVGVAVSGAPWREKRRGVMEDGRETTIALFGVTDRSDISAKTNPTWNNDVLVEDRETKFTRFPPKTYEKAK